MIWLHLVLRRRKGNEIGFLRGKFKDVTSIYWFPSSLYNYSVPRCLTPNLESQVPQNKGTCFLRSTECRHRHRILSNIDFFEPQFPIVSTELEFESYSGRAPNDWHQSLIIAQMINVTLLWSFQPTCWES